MNPRRSNLLPSQRRHDRRGFSFTEVLFAVMILGVGFIMVAAIFPVAIQQARSTTEEGNAAGIARSAVTFIEQNLTSLDMPALSAVGVPAPVQSFRDPQQGARTGGGGIIPLLNNQPATVWKPDQLWTKARGNLILAEDPRYAWVALYRRERLPTGSGTPDPGTPSPYAQVFIIVTQVRNRSTYSAGEDVATTSTVTGAMVNLQPRPVALTISGAAQQVTFVPGPNVAAVGEGAYLIISLDNLSGANAGRMNGRIYRVGNKVPGTATTWELMPGNDFVPDAGADGILGNGDDINGLTVRPANAFVVGRTLARYAGGVPEFEDMVQDIAVYTTFIQVR